MLLEIRNYLRDQKTVSNQQIAREFNIDISALQPMLDLWECKKVIQLYKKNNCYSVCNKCSMQNILYYQYIATI